MNREEVKAELARIINKQLDDGNESVENVAGLVLDFLDEIGYDPCFELGINIHGHVSQRLLHSDSEI